MIPRKQGPRIAVYDIETAPNLVYTWGLYKQNISPNMIVRDWSMLSVCWLWVDRPSEIFYYDCEENPLDDSPVVAKTWELMDTADILVGQNSKHFDTRKAKARMIEHGFPAPRPFKQIDTKVEASKIAMFTSNKLEWLSAHLSTRPKDKHKEFPGFELWSECLNGNPKAWAAMRRYNPRDVQSTLDVYLKLRPYMDQHPNVNVFDDSVEMRCPSCGGNKLKHEGSTFTGTGEYKLYRCMTKKCGAWSRSRYTLNSLAKRKSLLTSI